MKIICSPPEKWWQRLLRLLLKPTMVWLYSDKISHRWNWLDYSLPAVDVDKGVYVDSDSFASPHQLGWRECVVLEPTSNQKIWFLAFSSRANSKLIQQRCTIELTGPVRALIGPSSVWFIGLTPEGRTIYLDLVRRTRLTDPPWQRVPLV